MEIKKFRGLSNVVSPERFGPMGYLAGADNVDLDNSGKILTRAGAALKQPGSYHSLWSDDNTCLVASGNVIKRVNPDYTLTNVATLTASRRLSYNKQQNVVYFSNGVDTGRLKEDGRQGAWGVQPPVNQPVCAAGAGNLPPGRYQYALVFRRADGHESGTNKAEVFVLQSTGGLAFSNIEVSADPEVVDKAIYISGPDGTELYRGPVVSNGTTSTAYTGDGSELSIRLETMFDNPPPPGDIVECYNGVMYVIQGSIAWHSKPYQFEKFCYRDKWLQFPGLVNMFAGVNDGIYVGTNERVWFLQGTGPGDFKSKVVFDYGAIPYAFDKTTMGVIKALDEDQEGAPSGSAVIWVSERGVCFGMEGGLALNMTERTHNFPESQRGAMLVRAARGYTQALLTLEGYQRADPDVYG